MKLHEVEAPQGRGHVARLDGVLADLLERPPATRRGPFLLAIDGRSSSGKSTLACRIEATVPSTDLVHTDDIAWRHSRFGWDDLLIENVIEPLRQGEDVCFRPPAWESQREGCITASARAALVVIEGVGAGRRGLADLVDGVIWVQSDLDVADRRNEERNAGEVDPRGYLGWMAEEVPFQADQRTWERADLVICGSSDRRHDPGAEVVVLRP